MATTTVSDGRTTRPRRYYVPSESITLVPGVSHERLRAPYDRYVGTFEALQASGLLRKELLPVEGQNSISWRPEAYRLGLVRWSNPELAPGYIKITRGCAVRDQRKGHGRDEWTVLLTVSDEEQDRRAQEINRRNREVREKWVAERRAMEQRAEANLEAPVNTEGRSLAERQRDGALAGCELAMNWLTGGMHGGGSSPFSPGKTAALVTMLEQLMEAIKGAQTVEPRPAAQRGHLTVVWSAP